MPYDSAFADDEVAPMAKNRAIERLVTCQSTADEAAQSFADEHALLPRLALQCGRSGTRR